MVAWRSAYRLHRPKLPVVTSMKTLNQAKHITLVLLMGGSLLSLYATAANHHHQHKKTNNNPSEINCDIANIQCAKTVTSAFSPSGDLWRLWSHKQALYVEISQDKGVSFSQPRMLPIAKEKISSRNENRPKIAFDLKQGVYLSWASPKEKKYTADVRFSYSADYGISFTPPVTVNNDNLLAGHSFNEMLVTPSGDVSIVWLDGRHSYQLKKAGKKTNGSALYLAQANFIADDQAVFSNRQLANNTCVCCRIAMTFNRQNDIAILWRHIYGDNIREFALTTLTSDKKIAPEVIQVSYDHWKINGCPHQGGGISIDNNNRYHMVWFNQGDHGKGIFYANSPDQGKTLSKPLSVGKLSAQAAHPHIIQSADNVDIIWTEFNGIEHQLWHQRSTNLGKTFAKATLLSTAPNGADRPFLVKHNNQHYISWHRPNYGHWFHAL